MPSPANIDDGGTYPILGLSTGSLNADLVPAMDVSKYKWIDVYLGPDAYNGIITFQGSFDPIFGNPVDLPLYRLGNLDGANSVSSVSNETNTLFGAPVRFPHFRARMTSYTSGGATGILVLRSEGLAGLQLLNLGVSSVAAFSKFIMGVTANDGTANVPIAAGVTSDTIIRANKSMLTHVLVTATGTHQMEFYDNASAGSGTLVGLIPANPTVNGIPFVFKGFCANGITAKGNANNPGVTVFYTDIF